MSVKTYWASKHGDELVHEVQTRVHEFDQWYWSQSARQINAAYRAFNGFLSGSHQIKKGGAQGELSRISVGLFRTYLRQVETTVTSSKLNFEVSAVNGDYESTQQCLVGKSILSFYNDEKKLDSTNRDVLERAFLYGESFLTPRFNKLLGENAAVNPYNGLPVKTGDLEFKVHHGADVIRNFRSSSNAELKWWIVREQVNRYELASSHPDHAEDILSVSESDQDITQMYEWARQTQYLDHTNDDENVTIYTLYHDQMMIPGCEHGRETVICGNTVISDGPLSYKRPPICRLSVGDVDKTILSYSFMWDILSLQQAVDALNTAVLTNNLNHGLQLIWGGPNGNVDMKRLTEGCVVLKSAQKPEPIQLTASSPEAYKYMDILQNFMRQTTGTNQVSQGQVPTGVSAASALALLSAEAVRFQNRVQAAWADFCGEVGQTAIEALQAHASEAAPIVYSVVGKDRRSAAATFSRKDISSIRKVTVKLGPAIMGSSSGRVQIADNLVQNGMVQNAQEYLTVIETGVLERLDDSELMENQLIKSENERLQKGIAVQALKTDRHLQHIQMHKAVLSDPELRDSNPEILKATLAHIQEHEDLAVMVQQSPLMAQVCSLPPAPPPLPPPSEVPPTIPTDGEPQLPKPAGIPKQAPPELQDALNQKLGA